MIQHKLEDILMGCLKFCTEFGLDNANPLLFLVV